VIIQGTPEWHETRLGKVTASRIADLMAKTKSGVSASRGNYEAQLIAERMTGTFEEGFKSAAMDRGNEVEAEARAFYEFLHNVTVEEIGFVDHKTINMSGASPDGLVGTDGLFECKCPNTKTHIDTLLGGSIKGVYLKQMQWQMACTERLWCDFVSYDPRMPEHLQMFVQRVERDDKMIAEIESDVKTFLADLEIKIKQLESLNQKEAA